MKNLCYRSTTQSFKFFNKFNKVDEIVKDETPMPQISDASIVVFQTLCPLCINVSFSEVD